MISSEDILSFLVSEGLTPSSFGAQLDRMKFGLSSSPDPFRARDEAEARIMEQAELLRTIEDFKAVPEFRPTTSRGSGYASLEKVQRAVPGRPCQGSIALAVIKAYQTWGVRSPERALVAVYALIRQVAPRLAPPLDGDVDDMVQSFREGKAGRARTLAVNVYADAILALGIWLSKRNKAKAKR